MVNYNNGKIYKIEPICDYDEGDIYIGSTTKQYLSQRMTAHKAMYNGYKKGYHKLQTTSFKLFDKYGIDNCKILLIELVNVETKEELHKREAYHIRNLKCVNKYIPLRTGKEYREDNKESIIIKKKNYRDTHNERIKDWSKEFYIKKKDILSVGQI